MFNNVLWLFRALLGLSLLDFDAGCNIASHVSLLWEPVWRSVSYIWCALKVEDGKTGVVKGNSGKLCSVHLLLVKKITWPRKKSVGNIFFFFSIWNLCKSEEEEPWLNNTIYKPSKLDKYLAFLCPCLAYFLSKISTIQKYFTKLDETIIKLTHSGFLFCKSSILYILLSPHIRTMQRSLMFLKLKAETIIINNHGDEYLKFMTIWRSGKCF